MAFNNKRFLGSVINLFLVLKVSTDMKEMVIKYNNIISYANIRDLIKSA